MPNQSDLYRYHRHPEFNEHLLKSRLKRVPFVKLESFLAGFKSTKDIAKTKESLINEIINHYLIMKQNNDFMSKFGCFIRDFVLGANQSENIIELSDERKIDFIDWVNSWQDNKFIGRKYNFYKNVYLGLGQKSLIISKTEDGLENIKIMEDFNQGLDFEGEYRLSFPSSVFFLVAYNQEKKTYFSIDKLVEVHETIEFEIILRTDSPLVSIRGDQKVLRDFLSSAIEDINNPLSMVQSLLIGDFDGKKTQTILKPRKTIAIEELRQAINGKYLDITSPALGDQVERIKFSLKGFQSPIEETHPIYGPALEEALKEQEDSRIGFSYNGVTHTFSVTRNGGLYFRSFTPEEVITYILLKISNI
jgi:hypothetical protein